jgi:hypothetical protein
VAQAPLISAFTHVGLDATDRWAFCWQGAWLDQRGRSWQGVQAGTRAQAGDALALLRPFHAAPPIP